MKLFITGILILSSITAHASTGFECKDIYEKKILRMEKNANIKNAGKIAGTVVIGLTGGIAIATTFPLLPLGVAIFGTMFSFGPGILTFASLDALDPETGIRQALNAQNLMEISHGELIASLEESRELVLKKSLSEFSNRISHPEFLDKLVKETNSERLSQNLPALTPAQIIELKIAKITSDIMGQVITVNNEVSVSLAFAKHKGKVPADLNYDAWRQILINNQGQFCQSGKAVTLRKATKNIISNL